MAAYTRKQYSGAARNTTTTTLLTNVGTTVDIAATTGWPSIAGIPFYVVISPSSIYEEKCLATISGSTLTLTRAQDDTTASEHPIGSVIYPVFTASDADEANELVSKLTTKGDLLVTDGTNLLRLGVGAEGYFLKASSSASAGVEWASIPTINSLNDIGDVTINDVEEGDFLVYKNSASAWINETIHFITVSDTEPTDEIRVGDLWYNSSELELYTYYSGSWIQVTLTPEFPTVEELDNVYISTASTGDVLAFDGLDWYNDTVSNLFGSHIIALSGDVSGSVMFDGSASVNISTTLQPNSIALGADTTGNYVSDLTQGTGVTITHTPGEGSSPTIAIGQAVGTSSSVQFAAVTAPLVGNASTATTLENARTISLGGDISGSVSFNGSSDVGISTTIQPNSVALGTDTTGDYVSSLVAGTNIAISNNSGEGATPTISVSGSVGSVDSISSPDFIQFDITANTTPVTGLLGWDSVNGTLNLGLSANKHIHIGEESLFRVRNTTGTTIGKGTALYASGVESSGRIQVTPYSADGTIREVRFMGLASESIADGVNGFVQHFGHIRDLDTRGTSSTAISVGDETWAAGDILYIHPTVPGKLTNVAPRHAIVVALVIVRHQTTGWLFVRPSSGGHIEDIHDIVLTSPTDGQFLRYNSASTVWVNDTINLGTDTTGDYVQSLTAGTGVTLGNNSGESAAPTVAIGQDVATSASVTFARLIVQGDMEVQGTITRLNEANLDVDTAFIYLNANSASANPDMGIAFNYDDGTYRHAGLFRDSSDGIFKVFDGYEPEPVSPINTSDATYSDARFQAESLILTQVTGTAPMSVSSSTVVTNLNADKLDGQDGSYYAPIDSPTFTGTVSLPNDTVALGTQTTGNYVADVSGGAGVTITHTPGEGSTATISTTGVQTLGAKAGNYTLAAGDAAETIIIMDSSSANDLTVPSASAVSFTTGTSITIVQRGTGKTRILAGAGVTLLATPGVYLRARYSSCTLVKTENANEWFVIGDLAAS